MKLTKLGNNETQVEQNGFLVLYSYNTPVACRSYKTGEEFKTSKKWSSTTSKHINKWCSPAAMPIEQNKLEQLINES